MTCGGGAKSEQISEDKLEIGVDRLVTTPWDNSSYTYGCNIIKKKTNKTSADLKLDEDRSRLNAYVQLLVFYHR